MGDIELVCAHQNINLPRNIHADDRTAFYFHYSNERIDGGRISPGKGNFISKLFCVTTFGITNLVSLRCCKWLNKCYLLYGFWGHLHQLIWMGARWMCFYFCVPPPFREVPLISDILCVLGFPPSYFLLKSREHVTSHSWGVWYTMHWHNQVLLL